MYTDFKEVVLKQVIDSYSIQPDYPFKKFSGYAVLRHQVNKKWFALFMQVPFEKLGIAKPSDVWIVNLKVHPEISGVLRQKRGILPAYHMNKEKWISVLLDGTVNLQETMSLIKDSYELTRYSC